MTVTQWPGDRDVEGAHASELGAIVATIRHATLQRNAARPCESERAIDLVRRSHAGIVECTEHGALADRRISKPPALEGRIRGDERVDCVHAVHARPER